MEIGAERDAKVLPTGRMVPWAEGDLPHGEDIDLNEYPIELLKFKKCRSFRADLRHKLTVIIRAHGGYGHGGIVRTAERLNCTRQSVMKWIRWDSSPRLRLNFERIDNAYADAIETLVKERVQRKRKRRKSRGARRASRPTQVLDL